MSDPITNGQRITATTFQLTHTPNNSKFSQFRFAVGDEVNSPCGVGKIVELDAETGDCILEMIIEE